MSSTIPASEGFVPFRGFRTWYRAVGDLALPTSGKKFPLLVVHGGPGLPHDYLEPLEALAQEDGRAVVFYDQLGCGNSDKPDDSSLWSIDLFVEELATVRRELGLESVHLLGDSWGGMLALEYALRRPSGLVSLVLASSPASMPLHASEVNRLREELPQEVREALRRHEEEGTTDDPAYQEAMMTFSTHHIFRHQPLPEFLMRALGKMNHQVYETLWGQSELHITGALKNWDVSSRLGELNLPTLLTSGRYDEVTPAEVELLRNGIPDSQWVIFEQSAHGALTEETERYLEVLEDFLRRTERHAMPGI